MAVYGYHRTSTREQHLDRGIMEITEFCKEHHYKLERIYTDQQTGKDFNRPRYIVLRDDILREGDTLIITEVDRLGRNKKDTVEELRSLANRNIRVMILEIPTTLQDLSKMDNAMAKMILETVNHMLIELYAAMAQAEIEKKEKRQREGIERMKARGEWDKYGRPRIKKPDNWDEVIVRWKTGEITGNPYIKEKMDLDIQVSKLKLMKANHTSQKNRLEDNIAKHYPQQITILKERISGMQADIQTAKANLPVDKEQFSMKVGGKLYTDKKEAGTALVEMCKEIKTVNAPAVIGEYAGFKMAVSFDAFNHKFVMNLKGQLSHNLEVGSDPLGNISCINHALESMPKQLMEAQSKLETVEHQLETAKVEVTKPFVQEAELAEKLERLSALNALLNMDEKGNDGIDMDDEAEASKSEKEVADCQAKNIFQWQRKYRIQHRIEAADSMRMHLQKECP